MLRWFITFIAILQIAVSNGQSLFKAAALLRKQISQLPEDTARVNRLIQLAETERYIGLTDSAFIHAGRSAVLSKSLDYLPGTVESKLILIRCEIENENFPAADSEWKICLSLITQLSNKQNRNYYEAGLYGMRAFFWSRKLNADSSIHYLHMASSKLSPHTGSKKYEHLRASILNVMGHNLMFLNERDSAASYYLRALVLAEKMNDTVMMAQVNHDYASRLHSLPKEALTYELTSVKLSKAHGMMILYGRSLAALAFIYNSLNEPDSSCIAYRKAIPVIREYSRDSDEIATVLVDFTEPLIELDSLDHAEQLIEEAWAMRKKGKLSYYSFNTLWQYCKILHLRKKYDEEWKLIQVAEKMLGDHFIPSCTDALYDMKIGYYKATGNYKAAVEQMEKLTALRDTDFNRQQTLAVAELNKKYETEKKDKEIIKLNAEREIAAARISRQRILVFSLIGFSLLLAATGFSIYKRIQLKRKTELEIARLEQVNQIQNIRNRVSRDMHDDIGASLSKMGMLAQQAKLHVQKGNLENSIATFDKITSQSKEVVSGLSTIIWAINPKHDNLNSMLGFMRNYISDFFEGNAIQYSIDFPDIDETITINPELKRNLFLVLKESLNNIVKHSGATEVTIRFITGDGKYQFEIADNGKGIDAAKDKSFSNGLISMRKRMEEIKGLFNLNTKKGRGTSIELAGVLF